MEEKKSLMEEWEDDELTAEQEDQPFQPKRWSHLPSHRHGPGQENDPEYHDTAGSADQQTAASIEPGAEKPGQQTAEASGQQSKWFHCCMWKILQCEQKGEPCQEKCCRGCANQ